MVGRGGDEVGEGFFVGVGRGVTVIAIYSRIKTVGVVLLFLLENSAWMSLVFGKVLL